MKFRPFSVNQILSEINFKRICNLKKVSNFHFALKRFHPFDFTKKNVFCIESKNVNLICSKSTIGTILYFLSYFFITKVFLDNATQYCYRAREGQIQSKVLIVGWYYYFSILCHHQNLQIVVRSLFHYIESLI